MKAKTIEDKIKINIKINNFVQIFKKINNGGANHQNIIDPPVIAK